mgnify:CR=1 FL=1
MQAPLLLFQAEHPCSPAAGNAHGFVARGVVLIVALLVLVVLGIWLAVYLVRPAPPKTLRITAGVPGSSFTTYADKQTGFDLHIVQGERELALADFMQAAYTTVLQDDELIVSVSVPR